MRNIAPIYAMMLSSILRLAHALAFHLYHVICCYANAMVCNALTKQTSPPDPVQLVKPNQLATTVSACAFCFRLCFRFLPNPTSFRFLPTHRFLCPYLLQHLPRQDRESDRESEIEETRSIIVMDSDAVEVSRQARLRPRGLMSIIT